MVEQQRSAMVWVKEARHEQKVRVEQSNRKQETDDAQRERTRMRDAILRKFGREPETDLDHELDPGRELSR
jgi:hypothetical protein